MVADPADGKFITLVSSDGFEFVVLRDAAMISPAIKGMLGPGSEQPCPTLIVRKTGRGE